MRRRPQVSWEEIKREMDRCASRRRREYEALAEITGRSVRDLEAELTAPDPKEKDAR